MGKTKPKFIIVICIVLLCMMCACGKNADTQKKENSAAIKAEENLPETGQIPKEVHIPTDYAASIIVTINPQIKLFLSEDNVVIGAEYLNEDAKTMFSEISFEDITLEECMEEIINAVVEKEYLTSGGEISIEIAEINTPSVDSEDICKQAEVAAKTALENNEVTATVSVKQSDNTETDTDEISEPESEPVTETQTPEQPSTAEPVTSICMDCNGTGIICSECNGTGVVNCKACDQTGYETCHICNGSASISCHGCGGSGKDATSGEACRHCGGSGKITCDACHGSPSKLCTHCGGTLTHICPVCGGNKNCGTCGGSGAVTR